MEDLHLPRIGLLRTAQLLATASALTLICLQGVTLAQTTSLSGSLGAGAGGGNLGASLGGGSASGDATANGPLSSIGSTSVRLGRGSGSSTRSSLVLGSTRTNFTSAFSSSQPNAASIAAAVTDLSPQEQRKLAGKCMAVLAAPQKYDRDMITVCKLVSSL
jgi:hypothetical protein